MKRLNHIFSVLFVVAAFGIAPRCAAQAAVADDAPAWRLLPQVQVDSSGIFLSQLVVPPSQTVVPPQIRLAPAPVLGQTASLSRDQIADLVRKLSPELAIANWSGAAQVRISRRTRQLADSDMIDMLTATLQKEFVQDRGELELHLTHPWTPVTVPDEPLTLKAYDLPATGITSDCFVRCELLNGKERIGEWRVAVKASVWRPVPIANTELTRGQSLKDANVTMERRDILVLRDAFLNFSHADENLQFDENIPAGLPVLNHSVRIRPVIQRGQLVDGIYQDGALSISLKVELLEDGLLGHNVRVRNPKTKRELHGKVQNDQTVIIVL